MTTTLEIKLFAEGRQTVWGLRHPDFPDVVALNRRPLPGEAIYIGADLLQWDPSMLVTITIEFGKWLPAAEAAR